MKKKLLHYAKEIALFFIVMTIFANIMSWYKSQDLNKEKIPIKQARLINNKEFLLDTSAPTLVHIWASWCPTCSIEAQNIQTLSKHYSTITIAVKSGSDLDIKNYLDEKNLNFAVINDKHGEYAKKFNISAYPTTLIYDKNGELVFSEVGYTSTLGLFLRMWWASL